MSKKILIVEDEKAISDIIKFNLVKEGFTVATAFDGEEGLKMVYQFQPDIILLDVMLPKLDGFQVCRKVRESFSMPIIMLTAKEEEVDKVLGFELGADDYVTKPFGMRELIARIKANLRRVEISTVNADGNTIVTSKNIAIDLERFEVKKDDKVIELTLREFELLKFLATQANQIFTREQLLKDVWGYEYFGDIRTVDVTVRRLREKVEDDSGNPELIITKRGIGYYFRKS